MQGPTYQDLDHLQAHFHGLMYQQQQYYEHRIAQILAATGMGALGGHSGDGTGTAMQQEQQPQPQSGRDDTPSDASQRSVRSGASTT